MANDLEEKKLYNFFNYNKNHKFNRSTLSEKLHQYENIDQDTLDDIDSPGKLRKALLAARYD